MNIMFISYWGIRDGLTEATVIPHVQILAGFDEVDKIILITIERGHETSQKELSEKILHIPLRSHSIRFGTPGQILDFLRIPGLLKRYSMQYRVHKIIARGVLAGTLASKSARKTRIPYYVESYEPHAEYMKDAGVWKKWSLKYLMQKRWEKEQLRSASGILTVNETYSRHIQQQVGRDIPVLTVPCAVDSRKFKWDKAKRKATRKKLGFDDDSVVGIYAGKFGGLYLSTSELEFLRTLITFFPDLRLIFLTDTTEQNLQTALAGLTRKMPHFIVTSVPHHEVPDYLSAADFALSLVKPFRSARFNSPVKHGEYWANGLPVVMMEGIGDEREFSEGEKLGAVFNAGQLELLLPRLREVIRDEHTREKIPLLARKYRSFDRVKKAYDQLIITDAGGGEGHSQPLQG